MSFMPSGGVKAENMADYLAVPAVPAVSGSWMVDPALLRAGALGRGHVAVGGCDGAGGPPAVIPARVALRW